MRMLMAGGVLSLLGFSGYLAGVVTAYPGRSISLAAIMIGLTFVAIGRASAMEGSA
ncbi:hypothetical protein [Halorhabdus sp. BNX81]|uniref:hypothetical protein n=1 Tax=Halorhabdus sp. BNX81 TaxID=2980181 RepID=UPI0023DD0B40|nr:hypothetical protein [Halorhabdus sp. BNX81]